jgi:hypothetical protein
MMSWGGSSLAAARRAGRNGLGLLANGGVPGMQAACEKHVGTVGLSQASYSYPNETP